MNNLSHAARLSPDMLNAIADEVGTPAYIYDVLAVEAGIRRWIDAVGDPARISFAAKANTNLAVLALLERSGVGIEVATPGELARARAAGFPEARIVLGGVPKSESAVRAGIEAGVGMIVLQSGHEVEAAIRHASSYPHGPLPVGLRVRPGIRAGAHPSLETGRADAKFGFAPDRIPEVWERLASADRVRPRTLAFHLGSGLDAVDPYEQAVELMLSLVKSLAATGAPVAELDVGGGLGIDYAGDRDPEPAMLVEALAARLEGVPIELRFEPGRSVVARAGVLLTRVLYRRERNGRPALVCDAGYTDFARNALYGAEHAIVPVEGELTGEPIVEVLGPTCESGDVLGTNRRLNAVQPGDLLLLRDAGAYGFVMASNYNSRPRPPELLANRDGWKVVRPRESLEDLWRGEVIS
ncbi:MAG: diaminopimelate decarboxylase [marine benthic group bacterium]|jgi:diaminopimelate decarboxylase|nr:diaminopimelate decarboxylase [Gemmatimonadota bacterium]